MCGQCGTPFVTEEASVTIDGEESAKRFICPKCKIIYERDDVCIRCGSPVVGQGRLTGGEEPVGPLTDGIEKEGSRLLTPPEAESVGAPQATGDQAVKSKTSSGLVPPQFSLERLAMDKGVDKAPISKKKQKLLHLSSEAAALVILIGAGGYLFWSICSHFIVERPEASNAPYSQKTSSPVLPRSPAAGGSAGLVTDLPRSPGSQELPISGVQAGPSVPSSSGVADLPEVERLRSVLESIRQGNLRKNIDLFMSCYSPVFKGREGKRRETLETWESFEYLSLAYDLKNSLISSASAHATVEWRIKFAPKAGGPTQESQTILDVTFKKENDEWKIIQVRPVS